MESVLERENALLRSSFVDGGNIGIVAEPSAATLGHEVDTMCG